MNAWYFLKEMLLYSQQRGRWVAVVACELRHKLPNELKSIKALSGCVSCLFVEISGITRLGVGRPPTLSPLSMVVEKIC